MHLNIIFVYITSNLYQLLVQQYLFSWKKSWKKDYGPKKSGFFKNFVQDRRTQKTTINNYFPEIKALPEQYNKEHLLMNTL